MVKTKIAVLVSGGGTNLQALLDAQQSGLLTDGEIVLVIASNAKAYALTRAAQAGVPAVVCSRKELGSQAAFEAAISQAPQGILAEPLAGDPLRHTKNLVIILIHLLKQAAVAGGAHRLLCGQLEARFLQRLEESRAVPEVCRLADEAKRTFCRRVAAPRGRTASDPRIQRAIRYLEDHLTQKITLQQLATQAGLSREYFCTLFHQQTGKTVFAYLRWARIQLAKEMLAATENSLAAIASLLGFSSQSHFQRAFREVEGCTPFLYRRRAWREQGSLF